MRSTGNPVLDELLARELRYSQTRWTEVWLACIMVVFGAVLLAPGDTFALTSYAVIRDIMGENSTGAILLGTGIIRLGALYINGRKRQTPLFRTLGCMVGAFIFGLLGLGFALAAPPLTFGLVTFVFSAAELHASRRAGRDAFASDALGLRKRARMRFQREQERRREGERAAVVG